MSIINTQRIDVDRAFLVGVESNLDAMSAMLECVSNSEDWGATEINIILHGGKYVNSEVNKSDYIVSSIEIRDNGQGMSHDTVSEKFSGVFFDSSSHGSSCASGRNGVGVKTNLQYWKTIRVKTTTKDRIPAEWSCIEGNRAEIERTYKENSTLRPGDRDSEWRQYVMTRSKIETEEWSTADVEESGTTILLESPIVDIVLDLDELIKKLSYKINFLDLKKIPNNKITLEYRNKRPKANEPGFTDLGTKTVTIKPFYVDVITKAMCLVNGTSDKDAFTSFGPDVSGLIPAMIPGNADCPKFEYCIQILETTPSTGIDFVLSVCGSNIYDARGRFDSPAQTIQEIIRLSGVTIHSPQGFNYRVYGYITTKDIKLKRELRHNRTALATHSKIVKNFMSQIGSILKVLNKHYIDILQGRSTNEESALLQEIKDDLNLILKNKREGLGVNGTPKDGEGGSGEAHKNKHKMWICCDCESQERDFKWKTPLNKIPQYCRDGDIDGIEGCGSVNIEAYQLKAADEVDVKFVDFLGSFLPARYEESIKTVYLSRLHPELIQVGESKAAKLAMKAKAIEKSLFAIAVYNSVNQNQPFSETYVSLLRQRYEQTTDNKWKAECKKVWKERGVRYDQI